MKVILFAIPSFEIFTKSPLFKQKKPKFSDIQFGLNKSNSTSTLSTAWSKTTDTTLWIGPIEQVIQCHQLNDQHINKKQWSQFECLKNGAWWIPKKIPRWSAMPGNHQGEDHLKSSEKDTTANRPSPVPLLILDSGKQRASKCRNKLASEVWMQTASTEQSTESRS